MGTLTIRDLDDEFVEQLKDFTHEATASKALVSAARMALALADELAAERKISDKWYTRAQLQHQTLENLVPTLTQALELAGQSDLVEQV